MQRGSPSTPCAGASDDLIKASARHTLPFWRALPRLARSLARLHLGVPASASTMSGLSRIASSWRGKSRRLRSSPRHRSRQVAVVDAASVPPSRTRTRPCAAFFAARDNRAPALDDSRPITAVRSIRPFPASSTSYRGGRHAEAGGPHGRFPRPAPTVLPAPISPSVKMTGGLCRILIAAASSVSIASRSGSCIARSSNRAPYNDRSSLPRPRHRLRHRQIANHRLYAAQAEPLSFSLSDGAVTS